MPDRNSADGSGAGSRLDWFYHDWRPGEMAAGGRWAHRQGLRDRRNGCYISHVLTGLGDIELEVPNTRHFNPLRIVKALERRFREVRRRTSPMGVFAGSTSMERILFTVFTRGSSQRMEPRNRFSAGRPSIDRCPEK